MKEKELTIKSNNITPKQWSTLLLELKAPGLKKILGWGTKRHDEK